ncbi:MAG: hypothetical protein IBX40_09435 [Methanosarcinales archaeon]|nr:hypothetical protein [Methanosarcinales archaeon]
MDNITKFDGIDYTNTFAKRIGVMHELIENILSEYIDNRDSILDIGGGPGISAKMIEKLGTKAKVINIEPSTTIYDVPQLSIVEYTPLKMSFKEALDGSMPYIVDYVLMVSSAHEIALCNNRTPEENKKIFFNDLVIFIKKNLKKNGILIIGFPNYREGASTEKIDTQRRLTETLLGHSHPPEELFTVDEFSAIFGTAPDLFIQKPMDLTQENIKDTILMANVAVFKIRNL